MLSVVVKHGGLERFASELNGQAKQVRFATMVALTRTAKDAQKELEKEIAAKFDRPTAFTRRSIYIRPATKQQPLTSAVFLKNIQLSKGNAPEDVLAHQFVQTGQRIRKRLEKLFERAGLISAHEYLAPGPKAKIDDRSGNISRGQLQQITSQLRVGLDRAQDKSSSSRSKRNVKKAGEFFWSRGGRMARGVWQRAGRGVMPILLVIKAPSYRARISMQDIVQQTVDARFAFNYHNAYNLAMKSAR